MLRILCYNIHGGYDRRGNRDLTNISALMDAYDVDIGVFQEMETRISHGGALQDIDLISGKDRPHHQLGITLIEGEGWYGNVIVSRYPIKIGTVHNLETRPALEPRNAIDTLVETPIGPIRLIGTHLSLSPWERWSEVKNLVRLMRLVESHERKPLLLMGDINEWRPSSKLLRYLDEIMTPVPCGRTFPSQCPLFKLDRVWHDNMGSLKVTAERLQTQQTKILSDHLPLLITVT